MTDSVRPPTAPASAPVDPGADEKALADGIEAIRAGLRKAGGALGAAAAAIIGGLGYARLHELFPAPVGKEELLYGAAAAAAGLAIGGAALLAQRFFAAQRRVLLSARIPAGHEKQKRKKRGFSSNELELVREVFNEHARDETASNLHSLELRALRLERIGRQGTSRRHEHLSAEAGRLHDIVRIALKRAAATVIEHRSHAAVKGHATRVFLLVAATGVALLWGVADYSKGQRDLIELRKKCAEAVKVGATQACEPVVSEQRLKSDVEAHKRKLAARTAANREARARRDADLRALAARMPDGAPAAVTNYRRCSKLVSGRLSGQREGVRVAAVQACVGAARAR